MPKKDWMVKETSLDDAQRSVLNAILDKNCIVTGCAGSGKSILALIKAQRIQKERGNDYQIVVYTKALCGYMNSGRIELGLSKTFSYYENWRKHGCPSSDYIIVDEIQDFTKEEVKQFLKSSRKHFFFFGDDAQSLYHQFRETIRIKDINKLLDTQTESKTKNFELFKNYRLPLPVAKLAQYVGVDLDNFTPDIYASTEKELPRIIKCEDNNEIVTSIFDIINRRGFEDVALLFKNNIQVVIFHNLLEIKGIKHEVKFSIEGAWRDTLDFTTPLPKLMTYHSAKGLQFESVFLPAVMSPTNKDESRALYVAMTRTYKFLYIMYTDTLPDVLNVDCMLFQEKDIQETFEK